MFTALRGQKLKIPKMVKFLKIEVCGQTVLPDRSLKIGQKLVEMSKIQMRHFRWFSNNVHRVKHCYQIWHIVFRQKSPKKPHFVRTNKCHRILFLFLFFFRKILDPIFYSVCSCPWWLVPWYANSLGRLFHSLKELLNGQKSTVGSLNSLTIIFFLKLFFDFWSESDMVLGPDWGWRRMQTFGFLS